jgi:hypothetical protein
LAPAIASSDSALRSSLLQPFANHSPSFFAVALVEATADENLMTFVNMLGLVTFLSIVFYHFVVSSKADAEA